MCGLGTTENVVCSRQFLINLCGRRRESYQSTSRSVKGTNQRRHRQAEASKRLSPGEVYERGDPLYPSQWVKRSGKDVHRLTAGRYTLSGHTAQARGERFSQGMRNHHPKRNRFGKKACARQNQGRKEEGKKGAILTTDGETKMNQRLSGEWGKNQGITITDAGRARTRESGRAKCKRCAVSTVAVDADRIPERGAHAQAADVPCNPAQIEGLNENSGREV